MAPKKKKQPPTANIEILREQIQLVKAEKELKSALEKVKEQINKLLVSRRRKIGSTQSKLENEFKIKFVG